MLAGALVAGAATLLGNPGAESGAGQGPLDNVTLSDGQSTDASGGLGRPSSSGTSSAPPSSTSAPSTSDPPVTSSSTTTEAPPPPPPATTDPPAPPITPAAPDLSAQDQVVALVNTARQEADCGPVSVDDRLTAAAQGHASDMAARRYFDHTTPDGVTFDQRIRNAGYPSPGAENIARGSTTAEGVMELWMNSPGHRANILNCELNTIGVGLDRNGFYWVQNFGF